MSLTEQVGPIPAQMYGRSCGGYEDGLSVTPDADADADADSDNASGQRRLAEVISQLIAA